MPATCSWGQVPAILRGSCSSRHTNEKSEVLSSPEAQLRPAVVDSGCFVLLFQCLSVVLVPLVISTSLLVEERKGPCPGAKMGALRDAHLGNKPPLTPFCAAVSKVIKKGPTVSTRPLQGFLCSPGPLICMCGYVRATPWCTRGVQWTTCGSCLSPSTIRVFGIVLRSSGLVANLFTC